jgi:hypothetical protein
LVHRTPALKTGGRVSLGLLMILIALATLESAWFGWFFLEPLPNVGTVAGAHGLTRMNLLIRALPEIVPGLRFRDSYLGIALGKLSHLQNLPQRLPIVLAAGLIVGSAITSGLLILRVLRLRDRLDRWERLTLGFGLGTTALGLAALVVGRLGWLDPWLIRSGLAIPILAEFALMVLGRRRRTRDAPSGGKSSRWAKFGFAAVAGPFLLTMMLGAMLPCIDFDGLEYHLQGPKEYYQAGQIAYLPHNVYTNMPFGVEMLHLLGMIVVDDWWIGALVGQLVVASFAPATAAMIAMTAWRLGSPRAAWVAGVVYLTTPWVYRLAVLPYVEGPLCYFHAALVWAWSRAGESSAVEADPTRIDPLALSPVVGGLAGGAMAIKYPALISAVIPATVWAVLMAWRLRSWRPAISYLVGVTVVIGPWLGKNVLDTGNPVYPLGYPVFGGRDWSPDRDAQWSAAHGTKAIEAIAFVRSAVDVAGRSDWQSPLYAALVPLAWLCKHGRRGIIGLWIFSVYLFLTWWLLTHRLDRFWLPILPSMAVLAGLGSDWSRSRLWTGLLTLVMAAGIGSNLVYCSTELAGLNDWTGDLSTLRQEVPRLLNPAMARLDAELPPGAKPLMVGQAGVFHFGHPVLYNTVFDDDILEGLARGRSPEEVREALRRLGVTHLYVDWSEIERYRSPGNYGFTKFVTPEVFARLVEADALGAPTRPGPKQELYRVMPGPGRSR